MHRAFIFFCAATTCALLITIAFSPAAAASTLRGAIIGDYGRAQSVLGPTGEAAVASSIKNTWKPDIVVTVGDNNYPSGEWSTLDANIGQFYGSYIYPLMSSNVSNGSPDKINKFLPSLGNHGGYSSGGPGNSIRAYPTLHYLRGVSPNVSDGNATMRRYYSVVKGAVHFFMLNSNAWEPDGIGRYSKQAQWLKNGLAASTSPHRVVCFHHLPYTSNHNDPATPELRWPFKAWGASVVLNGHSHSYERMVDATGMTYLNNGLGGTIPLYRMRAAGPIPESRAWFNSTWGYQQLEADDYTMNITFVSQMINNGIYRDQVSFTAVYSPTAPPPPPTSTSTSRTNSSSTAAPVPSGGGNKKSTGKSGGSMAVGVLVGAVGMVAIGFCIFSIWYFRRARQQKREAALGMGNNTSRRHFSMTQHHNNSETDYRQMSDRNMMPAATGTADTGIDNM